VKDLPAVLCDDSDPINYVSVATRTEGYSPQDLLDLTNRALHKATVRIANDLEGKVCFVLPISERYTNSGKVILGTPDFEAAQIGYTPVSLRDVKLQKSDVEWADIGGEKP